MEERDETARLREAFAEVDDASADQPVDSEKVWKASRWPPNC